MICIEVNGNLSRGTKLIPVEIITVDKETLKTYSFSIRVPPPHFDILDYIKRWARVGEFIRFPDGKVFRRIRGGFRFATDADLAELIAARL